MIKLSKIISEIKIINGGDLFKLTIELTKRIDKLTYGMAHNGTDMDIRFQFYDDESEINDKYNINTKIKNNNPKASDDIKYFYLKKLDKNQLGKYYQELLSLYNKYKKYDYL